jgi:hypothetical protein
VYTSMLSLLVLYAALGFFLAPYLLEKTLTDTLHRDYAGKLRFEQIKINPFVLSLHIKGLSLDSPEGKPTIRIQEIFTNLQLSSVFRLALTFDEIRISAVELFVARDKTGAMDFAYLTQSLNDETSSAKDESAELLPLLIYQFTLEDVLVNWLDQVPAEALKTRFGPIGVNIKDLNTLANQSAQQTVKIATEDLGTLSWTGDLQLNPFRSSARASLEGAKFALISAYVRHHSGIEIVDGSANIELDYDLEQLEGGQIKAKVENFNLSLSDVVINSFSDGTGYDFAGPDQQILTLPKVLLTNGQLLWPEKILSLDSVSIVKPQIETLRDVNGVFNLEPKVRKSPVIKQDPAFLVAPKPTRTSDDEWQWSIGNFTINQLVLNLIDQSVSPEAHLGVNDFNLQLSDISNLADSRFPMSLSLQALSGGKVSLNGAVSLLPQPAFDLELSVDALQLAGANPYLKQQTNLQLNSGVFKLQGQIQGSAVEPFAYQGDFEIADLLIAESLKGQRLASWKRLRTDKVALSMEKRQLSVSQLQFDELYGDILIDPDGQLNLGQLVKTHEGSAREDSAPPVAKQKTEAEISGDAKAEEFKIQIAVIILSEASADFADLSLPMPFVVKIDELNGKMTTISNHSVKPSEIDLEAKVDKFGFARISGSVTPLDPNKNTNISVVFENINIPTLSPYTIPFAGRKIASGSLDLKLGYQLKDSQLRGDNSIILHDFELGEEVPHPDALDIPLGLAVALLKDAKGEIAIDLPVSGNVDNPDFSYGGVVWGALGNLLVKVVFSPFTLLGNLLGVEASELEHIKFLDGSSQLTPPEMQRAGKLVEALALRPELQLVIKGVSDAKADSLALKTAQVNKMLQGRIGELSTSGNPAIGYLEQRRTALENMMTEQLGESLAPIKLSDMQEKFTTVQIPEGQSEGLSSFDSLAYASALNQRLILLQELGPNALRDLADSRAKALKNALLSIQENLLNRIIIAENIAVTREEGGPIEMSVSLRAQSK